MTKVEAQFGALTFSTTVICSVEDNFCRREGRARAIDRLVFELCNLGWFDQASVLAEMYINDLQWLAIKKWREAIQAEREV